jgi:hypothetical protein
MMKLRLVLAVIASSVISLLGLEVATVHADAATIQCQAVPNSACSSWETPAGGGADLDVFQQRTAPDTPLIVYTPSTSDPAEDFVLVPVPAGSISIYTFAGSQTGTTGGYVNIEYAPHGIGSGLCISDIDPAAGQLAELRACNTAAGRYNPFQSFAQAAAATGDGSFSSFQDAPVSTTSTAPTGLYLSDGRPDAGIGRPGHRVAVVSAAGTAGALPESALWELVP